MSLKHLESCREYLERKATGENGQGFFFFFLNRPSFATSRGVWIIMKKEECFCLCGCGRS